jgi:N-acetylmuramoyl-L-alanine amidase
MITFMLVILCLPFIYSSTSAEAASTTITVNTDSLNVRTEPILSGEFLTSIHMGEEYPYIKKEGEWIQISLPNGKKGWVAHYLVLVNESEEVNKTTHSVQSNNESTFSSKLIYIAHNGTNIRKNPNTLSTILTRANRGDSFEAIGFENDWYVIKLQNGQTGYVAGWVVTENEPQAANEKPFTSGDEILYQQQGLEQYLQGKKIVIDPGHGGKDHGTTGVQGTLEKNITMETATRLFNKLKAAGADVTLTRVYDEYISLPARASISNHLNADAFISIHYDSFSEGTEGATTFFYHPWQKELAVSIHSSLINQTDITNRGVRKGDYYVIRENNQNAVLVELGFLSNPIEEILVTSEQYQILATTGIFEGLARYFKNS